MKINVSQLFFYSLIFTSFFCVRLVGHDIKQLLFSQNGSKVVFEKKSGGVQIWSVTDKSKTPTLTIPRGELLGFSENGKDVAIVVETDLQIFDTADASKKPIKIISLK